jgi:DNA-binding NtrC family response regulator
MPAILVIDNEPLMREMLTLVLENEGFSVVSSADGVQALLCYHHYRREIELVISDIVMPKMNGVELAQHLLAERPDLPIILMSDQADITDLGPQHTVHFLPKPFDLSTLLSTVRSLMAEESSVSTG